MVEIILYIEALRNMSAARDKQALTSGLLSTAKQVK